MTKGVDLYMGDVISYVGWLFNRSFTAFILLFDGAGEGACTCGFAIGLGIVIAKVIGVGVGCDSSPINDRKLLLSNVTSQDR